ncbi:MULTISPECIES: hypothetical protein [unclassified Phormidesmis]
MFSEFGGGTIEFSATVAQLAELSAETIECAALPDEHLPTIDEC